MKNLFVFIMSIQILWAQEKPDSYTFLEDIISSDPSEWEECSDEVVVDDDKPRESGVNNPYLRCSYAKCSTHWEGSQCLMSCGWNYKGWCPHEMYATTHGSAYVDPSKCSPRREFVTACCVREGFLRNSVECFSEDLIPIKMKNCRSRVRVGSCG